MLISKPRGGCLAVIVSFAFVAASGLLPGAGDETLAAPFGAQGKGFLVSECRYETPESGICVDDGPHPIEPCEGTGAPDDCAPKISGLHVKNGVIYYTLSERVAILKIRIAWHISSSPSGSSHQEFSGPGKRGANRRSVFPPFKDFPPVGADRLHVAVRAVDRAGNVGRAGIPLPIRMP